MHVVKHSIHLLDMSVNCRLFKIEEDHVIAFGCPSGATGVHSVEVCVTLSAVSFTYFGEV